MNAIFSAQKLVGPFSPYRPTSLHPSQKVTIDACQLFGPEAVFLQQAAHLTGGSFIQLERRDALLQYLIVRRPVLVLLVTYHARLDVISCAPIRAQNTLRPNSGED